MLIVLGATKWQKIRKIVIPVTQSGIFMGVVLSLSRALGESATLLMVGATTYVSKILCGVLSVFMGLTIQMYAIQNSRI